MSCIDSHVLRSAAASSRCEHELYGRLVGVAASVVDVLCAREFDLEIDAHWEPLTVEERELWWRLHACRRRIEFALHPGLCEAEYRHHHDGIRAWLESLANPPAPPVWVDGEDIPF